jgi:hypothetical protein
VNCTMFNNILRYRDAKVCMLKIYTSLRYVALLVWCGLFWQSCNTINKPTQVPTYIHVDSFNFVKNPAIPNISLSHQINSVWVYYNNNPIGIFDLPCTFPVITNGTGQIECYAVIAVDGQNNLLGQYPYYQPDTFTFAPQPGKIITHECTTSYYSDVVVRTISNFDQGATNFYLDAGNIPMTVVSANLASEDSLVFEGTGSGSILLTNPGVDSSVDSCVAFTIPPGVSFIEFNYKNDNLPFYVGLQSNLQGGVSDAPYYLAGVYPSSTWQKFYLKCSDYTAEYTGLSYNLYIKVSLPFGSAPGRVLLNNIQLITLP